MELVQIGKCFRNNLKLKKIRRQTEKINAVASEVTKNMPIQHVNTRHFN